MDLKKLTNVADVAAQIMGEALKGNQHKIDKNKNNKIDSEDFKLLRKEDAEQLDELSPGTLKSYIKGAKADKAEHQDQKASAAAADDYKTASDSAARVVKRQAGIKAAKASLNKEEIENLEEMFDKADPVGTRKKTAHGYAIKTATGVKHERSAEKDADAGTTDWDQEEKLAKKHLSTKPAKRKYGARQNYVRSTRVNESFSELLETYKDGGLKSLFEAWAKKKMMKEEPTQAEYEAEVADQKKKATGEKKQPEVAKASVQAVQNEDIHKQVQVIDMTNADEITTETIDLAELEERSLTASEADKKEEIVKSMKKNMAGFKERYGERAKSVMYATATKQAKKD